MPTFRVNESRVTDVPEMLVETRPRVGTVIDQAAILQPGRHRFQLVVEDNDGHQSAPAFVDVTVTQAGATGPGGIGGIGGIGGLGGVVIRPPTR